jgi:tetratricopeptide (TPR) repeat protein
MLTGQLPFQGVARMMLLAVLHKDPPPLRQYNDEIPRDVETIVLKAMSKDRDRRYQTAAEFADDLKRWQNGKAVLARPISRTEKLWRWSKRNRGIAALSAAVLSLSLLVAVGSVAASVFLAGARADAEQAATEAAAQRDQALETLESLVYEVEKEFEDGAPDDYVAAHEIMLDISIRRLREMTPREEDIKRLDVTTASAHISMAKALTKKYDYGKGRRHIETAGQILEKLGGENSDQWQVIKVLLEWHLVRPAFADHEDYIKDENVAASAFRDVRRIAKKAVERWPDVLEVKLTYAKCLTEITRYNSNSPQLDAVIEEVIPEAITFLENLEQVEPGNEKVLQAHRTIYYAIGYKAFYAGEFQEAITAFNIMVPRCESVVENETADIEQYFLSRDMLVIAHEYLGKSYVATNKHKLALKHLVCFLEIQGRDRGGAYTLVELNAIQALVEELREKVESENNKKPSLTNSD